MPRPRIDRIQDLIDAAQAGMICVSDGCTVDEVMSAYFTMTSNAIVVAKEKGAYLPAMREACLRLLMHCDDPEAKAN